MRVAFAGTPDFARTSLQALCQAGFEVPLVLTQPDRPAGRGLKLHPSAVKACAQEGGLRVEQPRSLRLDGKFPEDAQAARQALADAAPDVIVVVAYGLLLPPWVLALPRLGCLNVHASLLPRWRGAAPIQRAIEAGDTISGVTIMQMDQGLDTGDMLLGQPLEILSTDSSASLLNRLAPLGAQLLLRVLDLAGKSKLAPVAQPSSGVTYAHKIDKSEAAIDWTEPAPTLERRIRALDPAPGASTSVKSEVLKVWRAELVDARGRHGEPGSVLGADVEGVHVACGAGVLRLTELQRSGGKRLSAPAFLSGYSLPPGLRFAARAG